MILNHDKLVARLVSLGWHAQYGYGYTRLSFKENSVTERHGTIPAENPKKAFTTAAWAKIKRDLKLQGEEIYGKKPERKAEQPVDVATSGRVDDEPAGG